MIIRNQNKHEAMKCTQVVSRSDATRSIISPNLISGYNNMLYISCVKGGIFYPSQGIY